MKEHPILFTDEELGAIYKRANGEDVGKAQPITTARVFKAMRAALAAQPGSVGEPMVVLHDDGHWTPCKTEAGRALNDRLNPAGSREVIHAGAPTEEKPAQQDAVDAWTEEDMDNLCWSAFENAMAGGVSVDSFRWLANSLRSKQLPQRAAISAKKGGAA